MTTYCAHCGGENRSEAQFCRFCGQVLGTFPDERVASRVEEQESPAAAPETQIESLDAPLEDAAPEQPALPDYPAEDELQEAQLPVETIPAESPAPLEILAAVEADAGQLELPPAADDQASEPELQPEPQASDIQPSQEETGAFLAAGLVLQNRFRIVQALSKEEESLLYEAVDLQRCWGCQTVQTQPDLRFCEVCGAELSQPFMVNLRVIPAIASDQLLNMDTEWFEQDGKVYIVEIPAKPVHQGDRAPRIRLLSGFHTDVGQVREVDEDSLLALQLDGLCEMANSPVLAFFAVADGIGGQDAGEIASRIAVHTLAAQVMQRIFVAELGGNLSPIEELSEQLHQAILAANQAIVDLRETLEGSNMGCTLTAALLRGTTAVVANIGDSRTYLMHEGKLSQITRDHSMAAKMVEQNLMRPEEIYAFEQKGVIYRSLGDNFDLLVDLDVVELSIGDRLLLCSDGLWDMVRDAFIEDVLLEQYDPQPASERLVEVANMAGGEDNITVIVVDVRSPD